MHVTSRGHHQLKLIIAHNLIPYTLEVWISTEEGFTLYHDLRGPSNQIRW